MIRVLAGAAVLRVLAVRARLAKRRDLARWRKDANR